VGQKKEQYYCTIEIPEGSRENGNNTLPHKTGFLPYSTWKYPRINYSRNVFVRHSFLYDSPVQNLMQGRHGVVSIWDTDVGKPVSEIATVPHSFCVSSALEVDGNVLLAAPYQNTSQFGIWDTRDPAKPIRNIDPSKENNKLGMCMHLKLMKFGTKCAVVSSYEDGGIYFWDILTTKLLMSNKLHTQPALCLSVNKESNRGLSGSADNNIVAFSFNYDTLSLKIDAKLPLQKPGIAAIKFRDDEKIFASAGWDHRIRIFDAKKIKTIGNT